VRRLVSDYRSNCDMLLGEFNSNYQFDARVVGDARLIGAASGEDRRHRSAKPRKTEPRAEQKAPENLKILLQATAMLVGEPRSAPLRDRVRASGLAAGSACPTSARQLALRFVGVADASSARHPKGQRAPEGARCLHAVEEEAPTNRRRR
jgi:hypothetical protein